MFYYHSLGKIFRFIFIVLFVFYALLSYQGIAFDYALSERLQALNIEIAIYSEELNLKMAWSSCSFQLELNT